MGVVHILVVKTVVFFSTGVEQWNHEFHHSLWLGTLRLASCSIFMVLGINTYSFRVLVACFTIRQLILFEWGRARVSSCMLSNCFQSLQQAWSQPCWDGRCSLIQELLAFETHSPVAVDKPLNVVSIHFICLGHMPPFAQAKPAALLQQLRMSFPAWSHHEVWFLSSLGIESL